MVTCWLDPSSTLLTDAFPMPLDAPFTGPMAVRAGVRRAHLSALCASGHLRRVTRGVYAAAQAPDSVRFRARALALVVPECAVVTDRTAGWLHGVPALARGAHLSAPPLDLCQPEDTRTCRPGVTGGRRLFREGEVVELEGLRVTSPARTACDLGRRLWRFDALASLDGFLRLGVSRHEMGVMTERFAGYRGVRQLRALLPLADPRSESPGESALRLHWLDAGLPAPELQFRILDGESHERFRLDVPCPEVRYAAEYDGEAHHTSAADREHDTWRREVLADEYHWTIDVFGNEDVYGRRTDITARLKAGFARARRSLSVWTP